MQDDLGDLIVEGSDSDDEAQHGTRAKGTTATCPFSSSSRRNGLPACFSDEKSGAPTKEWNPFRPVARLQNHFPQDSLSRSLVEMS
jgi:hypothetical protein